jgi:hypothetical protein
MLRELQQSHLIVVTPVFPKKNRMHLICVPGSQFHTYDRLMSVISQDIAQNVQKRFINFYYTHEGDSKVLTRTTISMKTRLHLHLPQAFDWLIASSELLVVDEVLHSRFSSEQRKQG